MRTITIKEFMQNPQNYRLTSDDSELIYGINLLTREKIKLEGKSYEFVPILFEFLGTQFEYYDEDMEDFV